MKTYNIELPAEFRSGNGVSVEKATITRGRMEEILINAIEADRKRRGEPVAWHSKQYGVVWMAIKPGNLVAGTQWFIQGRQAPVAEVVSPGSLVWHIPTSELEHGTVFYTAPQPADRKRRGEPVDIRQEVIETLEMILAADWRKWEELASPDEFVRWAKSRANYALSIINEAPQLAEPCASSVSDKTACGSANGDCDSQPAEPVKVPSDADLLNLWYSLPNPGRSEDEAIVYGRALLARYGNNAGAAHE